LPFDTYLGARKHIYFDGSGYFYTADPGYYRVTCNFNARCSNTDDNTVHDVNFVMMNQSGGEDNLYLPFHISNDAHNYSFTGILPGNFNNVNGELHFAFETNDTMTIQINNISVSINFYA